jgi:hypothetical protein
VTAVTDCGARTGDDHRAKQGEIIMQSFAATAGVTRTATATRATLWQVPALIFVTLLLGLVASIPVHSYDGNPAPVDGMSALLSP